MERTEDLIVVELEAFGGLKALQVLDMRWRLRHLHLHLLGAALRLVLAVGILRVDSRSSTAATVVAMGVRHDVGGVVRSSIVVASHVCGDGRWSTAEVSGMKTDARAVGGGRKLRDGSDHNKATGVAWRVDNREASNKENMDGRRCNGGESGLGVDRMECGVEVGWEEKIQSGSEVESRGERGNGVGGGCVASRCAVAAGAMGG